MENQGATPPTTTKLILDQNNYLMWKSRFVHELLRYDFFFLIDGSYNPLTQTVHTEDEEGVTTSTKSRKFPLLDKDMVTFIRGRITEKIKASIPTDCYASSRSLWVALEKMFAVQSKAFLKQLRSQFRSMRQETPSITKYLERVEEIVDTLEASGKQIPIEDLVIEVLAGLGPEYEFELAGTKRTNEISYDEVTEFLISQKRNINSRNLFHYQPIRSPTIGI